MPIQRLKTNNAVAMNGMGYQKKPCRKQWVLLFMLMVAAFSASKACAHALDQSYVFLTIDDNVVSGRIEMTIADINKALSLDLSTDKGVTREDIEPHIDSIKHYLQRKVAIAPQGLSPGLTPGDFELVSISLAQYLLVHFSFPALAAPPEYIDVDYQVLFDVDPEHRGLLVIENNWKTGTFDNEAVVSLIFDPDNTNQQLDLTSSTVANGFLAMVKLGMHHIWVGIDHVLFLLALLLPSVVHRTERGWEATGNFRDSLVYVVKIVTLFTLAHTITLSAATLGAVSLSSRLVESVIAISIAIAAVDILYPVFRGRIWSIVFVFGLFHGFGFASVLSSIGIPPNYMTHSLLAFNLGVELGQLAIVCLVFPLLYALRSGWFYSRVVLQSGASALIVVSLYWFIERGFLIDLPAGAFANWILGYVGLRV